MKPIYITDLDHTFLRSDQSVSDFSKKVWNDMSTKAILTVATARSFQKTHDFLHGLNLYAPLILLDGCMIVSSEKKLIDVQILDKTLADAIIEEGKKFDIAPFVIPLNDKKSLDESFLFPSSLNTHQEGVLENYRNDPRMLQCRDIRAREMNLKLVYFGEYQRLKPLTEHLQKVFGKVLEYKLSPEKYSDGWFLTLLHPEGDKAFALEKVMHHLGRDLADVTVFGDSINDIEMFKCAGKAVAISNALDEVKEQADIILSHTNDEDGVAHYLKSMG